LCLQIFFRLNSQIEKCYQYGSSINDVMIVRGGFHWFCVDIIQTVAWKAWRGPKICPKGKSYGMGSIILWLHFLPDHETWRRTRRGPRPHPRLCRPRRKLEPNQISFGKTFFTGCIRNFDVNPYEIIILGNFDHFCFIIVLLCLLNRLDQFKC